MAAEISCARCRRRLPDGAHFCTRCGLALPTAATIPPPLPYAQPRAGNSAPRFLNLSPRRRSPLSGVFMFFVAMYLLGHFLTAFPFRRYGRPMGNFNWPAALAAPASPTISAAPAYPAAPAVPSFGYVQPRTFSNTHWHAYPPAPAPIYVDSAPSDRYSRR